MSKKQKKLKSITPIAKSEEGLASGPTWGLGEIERRVAELASFYNFQKVILPVLENKNVLEQTLGLNLKESQFYLCQIKGGEKLVFLPPAEVGVAQVYLKSRLANLGGLAKFWYWTPVVWLSEKTGTKPPLTGKLGFEIFGSFQPAVEIELIQLGLELVRQLSGREVYLELNSLGCVECRRSYRRVLKQYYRYRLRKLCSECRGAYEKNPLQLLTCNNQNCLEAKAEAPEIFDSLCKNCNAHFKKVLDYLDNLAIPYLLNSRLVEETNYSNRTVFEFKLNLAQTESVETREKPLTLARGSRHDLLVKQLGGSAVPAVGLSFELASLGQLIKPELSENKSDVFLVQLGDLAKIKVLQLLQEFRKIGLRVGFALGEEGLKPQLKLATQLGARFLLIIGQEEALHQQAIIREAETGVQETVNLEKVIEVIEKKLKQKKL